MPIAYNGILAVRRSCYTSLNYSPSRFGGRVQGRISGLCYFLEFLDRREHRVSTLRRHFA